MLFKTRLRSQALLLGSLFGIGAIAQTTALDFTEMDCSGTTHQLFSELNAGNAVVIDLVMMACTGCITASAAIADQVVPTSNDPSRVKFYSIGYLDEIACPEITEWATTNGFTHPVFAGMAEQVTYYGGMGMPTIIVLGGSDHHVYYNHLGFAAADKTPIKNAINDALAATVGIAEQNKPLEIAVVPDPVVDRIELNANVVSVRIVDAQGAVVIDRAILKNGTLNVRSLPAGAYVLRAVEHDGSLRQGRFVKQ